MQVELLVPGLQALNVEIGAECTIDEAREELVNAVDLCLHLIQHPHTTGMTTMTSGPVFDVNPLLTGG